jgi:hypothetical protein
MSKSIPLLICMFFIFDALQFFTSGCIFAQNSKSLEKVRSYSLTRLNSSSPEIDGKLDDVCWKTGEWTGNFTQWIPKEKGVPSQKTELKILYDNENLYVAIRAYDNEPEKILRTAGRRDEFKGDIVGVCFDSYHDHRTGFEFDVTAAGQKIDLILTNPMSSDENWNAVWYAKAGSEDSAWVAEMQIPLSQLRFRDEDEQTWGLHCWRWIDRLKEEDDWEIQELNTAGMLYLFGHINGIKGIKKNLDVELVPYVSGKLSTYQQEINNPYKKDGKNWNGNAGLDGKINLSNSFAFNFTINPDFGQVEADPSEMNLTAFETFFEEKRPFFLEGKNIFDFSIDDINIFYSRRIGHLPLYTPSVGDNEYIKMPDKTTILDAVKLSGKTDNGFSVGIIQSLTSDQSAKISINNNEIAKTVEPMTNYLIGRVQKDFNEGSTVLGGILTMTNRFIRDDYLNFMNRGAYTCGFDLLHYWDDKEYYVNAKVVGSLVNGDNAAMLNLQKSSARYYQRPDIMGSSLDSTLTQLYGHGGKIIVGKASKGLWKYSANLSWRSTGLELNDAGYMQTADLLAQGNSVTYSINQPSGILKTFSSTLTQKNNWNYSGEFLYSSMEVAAKFGFNNNWSISTDVLVNTAKLDTKILRGGNAMKMPSSFACEASVSSDNSKRIYFSTGVDFLHSTYNSLETISYEAGINFRPVDALYLSVNGEYTRNTNSLQYISKINCNLQNHYILGRLEQETLELTFRIDWNLTPELSIQYYGSPFAAVGAYSEYKDVINGRADNYSDRFIIYNSKQMDKNILLDINKNGKYEAQLSNPDFSYSQFRSNLVFRWEYRPGSQLYFVWASDLTNLSAEAKSIGSVIKDAANYVPDNIFLVKLNYWFSI